MRIIQCDQGSPEWGQCRQGIPTASNFDKIVTPAKGELSKQADAYIYELIADRIMGVPENVEAFTSREMQYGIDTEPEARAWYQMETGLTVRKVGFCVADDGSMGCSPDGLVDPDGGIEIKCPLAKTHIGYLMQGGLPTEYKLQVHGSLVVTGRRYWSFVSYCPGIKPVNIKVEPDDFTAKLRDALEAFTARYAALWEKMQQIDPDLQPRVVIEAKADAEAAMDMFTA